jgi:hypothetical protein|tara:strand:- start:44 stop:256 length:213 start_codon:yes stop_codon:yes gene_type:complete
MFNKLGKLIFLYVILTLLFSDLSEIKDPGKDFFKKQYEGVVSYIDNTVIPYVDKKFDEVDSEKGIVENLF